MEFAEMKSRAERMRSRDLYGVVSKEELDSLPVTQTELYVPTDAGEVHVYEIHPLTELAPNSPMIINFHGGGFIKGRQDKDLLFCGRLASELHVLVWDVDYRLAPEYPYPTAKDESYAVCKWAGEHASELGIDPSKIALLGHSAGGNLAITVCMKAGETGAFKPAALMAEYCPLDLATDPATKPRAEGDMPAEVAKTYNAFYCDPETAKDPYVSPLFATKKQLKAFPETMMLYAENDSLSFEDAEFAAKLSLAGVKVTSKCFPDSLHGFTLCRNGGWEESMAMILDFLEEKLNG